MGGDARDKIVGLLGLTFKPNTDDMRDAPSLAIVQALIEGGAKVRAFDPEGMEVARAMMPGVEFVSNAYDVAEGADAVAIITEWDAFRALDLERLGAPMRSRCLVDLRNIYQSEDAVRAGFDYTSIGRG
jgi:UDPglucose 6-dehydrogenase